ncbi:hypothetical protein Lalb_Chr05g0220551 [Lupinus albus]|uniref:Uncharacterized protein n=1 Tax=Lupinus albus TaxID=3870 RepID=A0A6A4QH62_LUPAL|nr:hypothetical protein Lalb_Chr05g0220551 [Lupinus albus]
MKCAVNSLCQAVQSMLHCSRKKTDSLGNIFSETQNISNLLGSLNSINVLFNLYSVFHLEHHSDLDISPHFSNRGPLDVAPCSLTPLFMSAALNITFQSF